ncbi:hypothetical protein DSO57_1026337 [Entomophthora muscae]|uniref:Uncharacterized protein n=1 Tax=Entomophthora muscae TaxID=34485 RepID=A0ACC2RGS8_9FUNG|nr:hypothetical protein DSO57_1026337 [Entomophthora muscae]
MLVPLVKFVIFTLAPTLFLIWSTSPKLWTPISSSAYLADEDPSFLLYLLEFLPGKANGLLSTGEPLVCSLTCDDMEFTLLTVVPLSHLHKDSWVPAPVESIALSPTNSMPSTPEVAPRCTSWLVAAVFLMILNAYLPQLTPVQAAISFLHCMASWWVFLPGWEPSLNNISKEKKTGNYNSYQLKNLQKGIICHHKIDHV